MVEAGYSAAGEAGHVFKVQVNLDGTLLMPIGFDGTQLMPLGS
jgi:hypothetical protein